MRFMLEWFSESINIRLPQCSRASFLSFDVRFTIPSKRDKSLHIMSFSFFSFEINYIWIKCLNKYVASFHIHVHVTNTVNFCICVCDPVFHMHDCANMKAELVFGSCSTSSYRCMLKLLQGRRQRESVKRHHRFWVRYTFEEQQRLQHSQYQIIL